jgi:hypothetical protein
MLIGMYNVTVMTENKIGNFGDKTLAIGTGQK